MLDERHRLIAAFLAQLEIIRQSLAVRAAPSPVLVSPELRPIPGRPVSRIRFNDGAVVFVDAYEWAMKTPSGRKALGDRLPGVIADADYGRPFREKKQRGLSRLYREALDVLKCHGASTPAAAVRRKLKDRGVISTEGGMLCWLDDARRPKKTTVTQFAKRLSDVRKLAG